MLFNNKIYKNLILIISNKNYFNFYLNKNLILIISNKNYFNFRLNEKLKNNNEMGISL